MIRRSKKAINIRSMIRDARFIFASKIAGIMAVSALALSFFAKYVPFNMDEFISYVLISYNHSPLNRLNVFREALTEYYLAPFPNIFLPLRSFYYTGTLQAFLYYPIFILWASPLSARLLGLIMLAFQAYFLYKTFKTDIFISFIFLIFFMPYAYIHIADIGPMSFHTTSVLFICYLLSQWMASLIKKKKFMWKYPFLIGIILFLGVWYKIAYTFVLPGLFLLILYYMIENRKIFRSVPGKMILVRSLIVMAASAMIPTFLLLNSVDPYGLKYYKWFTGSGILGIFDFSKLIALCSFFTNPLKAANGIFVFGPDRITAQGILLILIIITFIVWGTMQLRSKKIKIGFIIVNLLCFFMTLLLESKSDRTYGMHHVVLSLPFLVLALSYIYSKVQGRLITIILAALFLMVNINLYFNITRLEYQFSNHPNKIKLNELLNKKYANRYVFVVVDWGMYYIKALYGPRQECVLYIQPFNSEEQAVKVKEILHKIKRKALFIYSDYTVSDIGLIKREFPSLIELRTDFDTGKWKVLYER